MLDQAISCCQTHSTLRGGIAWAPNFSSVRLWIIHPRENCDQLH